MWWKENKVCADSTTCVNVFPWFIHQSSSSMCPRSEFWIVLANPGLKEHVVSSQKVIHKMSLRLPKGIRNGTLKSPAGASLQLSWSSFMLLCAASAGQIMIAQCRSCCFSWYYKQVSPLRDRWLHTLFWISKLARQYFVHVVQTNSEMGRHWIELKGCCSKRRTTWMSNPMQPAFIGPSPAQAQHESWLSWGGILHSQPQHLQNWTEDMERCKSFLSYVCEHLISHHLG